MNLILNNVFPYEKQIIRKFEGMGTGLVLINVSITSKHPSPYHWMLADDRKPPFDISIDPSNGSFNYLKFFLQDEKIKYLNTNLGSFDLLEGIPCFDTNLWSEKQNYFTIQGKVDCHYDGENLHLSFSNENYTVTTGVLLKEVGTFLFDQVGQLKGLIISKLNKDELNTLMTCNVL